MLQPGPERQRSRQDQGFPFQFTTNMAPGDIILLHVGAQGADYDALPGLIEVLRTQGFTFVTIEQILQR